MTSSADGRPLVTLRFSGNPNTSEGAYYVNGRGRTMAEVSMADGRTFRYWLMLDGVFGMGKRALGTWSHLYTTAAIRETYFSSAASYRRELASLGPDDDTPEADAAQYVAEGR